MTNFRVARCKTFVPDRNLLLLLLLLLLLVVLFL
jgi:hypothetical protein